MSTTDRQRERDAARCHFNGCPAPLPNGYCPRCGRRIGPSAFGPPPFQRLRAAAPPRELAPAPCDERLVLAAIGLPPLADDDDLPLTADELAAVSGPGPWHLTATGGGALAELMALMGRLR